MTFLLLFSLALPAQTGLWRNVPLDYRNPAQVRKAFITEAQRQGVIGLLKQWQSGQGNMWACKITDPKGEWLQNLRFETIDLAENRNLLLVEAGPGCARSGQGANGTMWLIDVTLRNPIFLATPQQDFEGFLYSVQPTKNHGYRDVVLGSHRNASEVGLIYFKFDGKSYRKVESVIPHQNYPGAPTLISEKSPGPSVQ